MKLRSRVRSVIRWWQYSVRGYRRRGRPAGSVKCTFVRRKIKPGMTSDSFVGMHQTDLPSLRIERERVDVWRTESTQQDVVGSATGYSVSMQMDDTTTTALRRSEECFERCADLVRRLDSAPVAYIFQHDCPSSSFGDLSSPLLYCLLSS